MRRRHRNLSDSPDCAPNRKFKTAVEWELQRTPWCRIGPEFRAECEAIASGVTPETGRARPPESDLRQLRVKRGLSQRALAQIVGCYHTNVHRAEHGGGGKWPAIIRKVLEG
jgi:DNA-binding XRE family transcriptional regulator